MLTKEQRAQLDVLDPAVVRERLIQLGTGPDSMAVASFTDQVITRRDIEDWLADKHRAYVAERQSTLRWAKIAGWAGMAAVLVGIAAIIVAIRLAK